jgi:uncharacterized SAM-binding protein YcdF (DUF218 family)
MFFALSKIFWILAAPSHWLGLLIFAAALCLLLHRPRAAKVLVLAAAAELVLAWLVAVPLARDWESRYPRPAWPRHVDGVLVLGGGFDSELMRQRHAPQTNDAAYRLAEGYAAVRRYSQARLVFSGGSGAMEGKRFPESDTARQIFLELGQDQARMVLESRSRNTYENILFSKAMVKPKPGEVWLLVTSAMHMPRAMAIARKLDWQMTPWPSDFRTGFESTNPSWSIVDDIGLLDTADNLGLLDYVVHEWVGLAAYRVSGKAQ